MEEQGPERDRQPRVRGPRGVFRGCAVAERWMTVHPGATVALVAGACLVVEVTGRAGPGSWDWVWVSGMVAVALGLPPALRLMAVCRDTVDRLAARGVLTGSPLALIRRTGQVGELMGRVGGPLLGVAVLLAFLTRVASPSARAEAGFADVGNQFWEVALGSLAAFFVGRAAGSALAIATLGRRVTEGPWEVLVQPGHVDGAAGLKPLGALYFRQAMIIGIPALWLVLVLALKTLAVVGADGWDALHQVVAVGRGWGPWYFALLVAAVALEIAAFLLPMLSFHRLMVTRKVEHEREADQRSQLLHQLEEELPTISDDTRRSSVENRISRIREYSLRIEQMPTWPVDTALRRRFAVRNVLLLVPVIANAVGLSVESDTWGTLSDVFSG